MWYNRRTIQDIATGAVVDELILILVVMAGIFLLACSIGLVALGKIVDRYPADRDETRERSLSSPAEATKLMVVFVWILFVCGAVAALEGGRLGFIFGIAAIAAACLFVFTGLIFSFVVLAMMRRREKTTGDTVLPLHTAAGRKEKNPPSSSQNQQEPEIK
jgi:MFS family permease